jgi:hypothetical protein
MKAIERRIEHAEAAVGAGDGIECAVNIRWPEDMDSAPHLVCHNRDGDPVHLSMAEAAKHLRGPVELVWPDDVD